MVSVDSLGEEFLALKTDTPKIFYIWGHAYEFDIRNEWNRFEEFCRMMFVFSGFLSMGYCVRKNKMLKVDILANIWPKLKDFEEWVEIVSGLVVSVICFVLPFLPATGL